MNEQEDAGMMDLTVRFVTDENPEEYFTTEEVLIGQLDEVRAVLGNRDAVETMVRHLTVAGAMASVTALGFLDTGEVTSEAMVAILEIVSFYRRLASMMAEIGVASGVIELDAES